MSYIGAEPTTAAFPFDQFSGNGSTTAFTLTYAPASATSIIVAISGVVQNPNLYSVVGTTLTFSPAPPTGTNNISVLYLGLPVIGSSSPGNTAFLSATDLTATASQTVFASAGSYTPGFVQVYRNGARLGNADFTATNGTTITLASAATAGDLVTIEYYTLTSLTNALPLTGGTVTGSTTFNTGVNLAAVSGSVGIGTTTPTSPLEIVKNSSSGGAAAYPNIRLDNINSAGYTGLYFQNNGTNRAFLELKNDVGTLTLGTGNIGRMLINSSGLTTLPYQPVFYATASSAPIQPSGQAIVALNTATLNITSSYNTSTYKFTAPIAGKYLFIAAIGGTSGMPANSYFGLAFQINAVTQGLQWQNSASGYQVQKHTQIFDLSAGDTVNAWVEVQNAFTTQAPYFQGWLLG